MQRRIYLRVLSGVVPARFKQVHFPGQQVDHALESRAHADGPGHWCAGDVEHLLHIVNELERVLALAIELVDEGHDRRVAEPANLHQLDRALLDALRAVDDHQRRVDRGEHAVGVL